MKSLIRDYENGLLSRFMFFCINATPEWLDGFDSYGSEERREKSAYVRRQVARAIQAGEIQQVKHGEYKKL